MAPFAAMSTIQARFDAAADRYRTWWEPVLAPTALALLNEIALPSAGADAEVPHSGLGATEPGPGAARILDLGTGAGLLALAAVRRWPRAIVVGLDGSTGMLAVGAAAAERQLTESEYSRLEFVSGHASRLPFEDATFDIVISSFVLQLVPHRPSALAEARRVLRPGGRLAFVTWLVGSDDPFAPEEAFEQALDELEIDEEGEAEEARSGDFASAAAAAGQLRRAGFREVQAREAALIHHFDPAAYLDFLERYSERDVFESLDDQARARLRAAAAARLARLPREAFTWQAPVVYASGRRSTG